MIRITNVSSKTIKLATGYDSPKYELTPGSNIRFNNFPVYLLNQLRDLDKQVEVTTTRSFDKIYYPRVNWK